MTTIENAREFLHNSNCIDEKGMFNPEALIIDHSKHVVQQVITFLEANEKKSVKAIIEELKGKV